jgi:hypothetical protein
VSAGPLFATFIGVLGERASVPTLLGVRTRRARFRERWRRDGWRRRDLVFPPGAAAVYTGANAVRRTALESSAVGALPAVKVNETAALVMVLGYVAVNGQLEEFDAQRVTHGLFVFVGFTTAAGMVSLFAALMTVA